MFDFFKRKPVAKQTSRAVVSADPELDRWRAEVSRRQGQAAELEADLMESRESLAAFQREFEARLGPPMQRVNELHERLQSARRAAMQRMWAESRYGSKFVDVEEQFRTAWTQTDTGAPPPPPPKVTPNVESDIKALYRELAKRFHPDLAATEEERAWRTPRMAVINAAYAARDLATLQKFAAMEDRDFEAKVDSREALLESLRRECERLDELIENLEREFDELANSPALQMQLNASMAKRSGRDLIGEAVKELEREAEGLERELKGMGY